MRTSDRGIAALVAHEGIVPGPYLDSAHVWSYGIMRRWTCGGARSMTAVCPLSI